MIEMGFWGLVLFLIKFELALILATIAVVVITLAFPIWIILGALWFLWVWLQASGFITFAAFLAPLMSVLT